MLRCSLGFLSELNIVNPNVPSPKICVTEFCQIVLVLCLYIALQKLRLNQNERTEHPCSWNDISLCEYFFRSLARPETRKCKETSQIKNIIVPIFAVFVYLGFPLGRHLWRMKTWSVLVITCRLDCEDDGVTVQLPVAVPWLLLQTVLPEVGMAL